jgi:hypothetical protein
MKVLYFTCPSFDFSSKNQNSILIDSVNCDFSKNNTYHTTLGDLSVTEILLIANQFDKIVLDDSGFEKNDQLYSETVSLLEYVNSKLNNVNISTTKEKSFIDNNLIFDHPGVPSLWIFGCSHSYGTGLEFEDQRYGNILSKSLNMPLKMIAKAGGSMNYSLRHIVNSCFDINDLIIWQIINPARLSYFNGKHVEEIVLSNSKNRTIIDFFSDSQIYFNHFNYINIGVQYLRSRGCNFILTSVDHNDYNYLDEYKNYPEYILINDFAVDRGSDNIHFGKLSHKNLALSLLNHIHYIDGKLIQKSSSTN